MFRCSETWVRSFLLHNLHWRMRKSTRAAQKLPTNVDEVCQEQFFRLALTICDNVIHSPVFYVNINQTNVVFQPITSSTYEEIRLKQVAVVGQEEKRAFTLVVGISAAGDLLPFQAIYQGKSKCSLPSPSAPSYNEAMRLNFKLEFSNTDTYWSTYDLMCSYVTDILVPYWMKAKLDVGALTDQECVLQLDVWTVHRAVAFRTWLDVTWPWIKYRFVPASTTGVAQPCDVGIQRLLKLSIKECQHSDVVKETLNQLQSGIAATDLWLDVTIGTLCNRSVHWLVSAHKAINKPEIVKKVK
ncbi:hypothetical protein BDN67DRAFT_916562 [Paxillus ammoniavirescens]|nr:hypothetical protein BDN67DRAFT_916562 [Paxillus ammoniavirescens]